MLKMSIRERLEQLAFLFIVLLIFLYISGMFFIGTKLEFDRNSARFREKKHFLAIPYHTSTRDTWLTQFNSGNQPVWESIASSGSRRSVWHGVAGGLLTEIRSIGHVDEMGMLSESSRVELSNAMTEILQRPGDVHDNMSEARAWFDCVFMNFPFPKDSSKTVSEDTILDILEDCKIKLQD